MDLRRRIKRLGLAASLPVVLGATFAASAGAAYHENLVREIHEGSGGNGDFIELQAFSAGQNVTAGRYVATYDGGGTLFTQALLPTVPNGANQASILIAHDAGVPGADVVNATLNVVNTGGYVCFTETVLTTGIDCVAYGNVSGVAPPSPAGTPAAVADLGLDDNQSLTRTIARGCATALDPADDTNNSVADFALAVGTPRGNATPATETLCPTQAQPGQKKKKCKKKKRGKAAAAAKKKCKKKKKK